MKAKVTENENNCCDIDAQIDGLSVRWLIFVGINLVLINLFLMTKI